MCYSRDFFFEKVVKIYCGNYNLKIRGAKYDLIIKLITQMDENHKTNLLNLINMSIEIV
jgi:hypothetical protein